MADAAMYNVEAEKEILSVIISKPNKLYDISRIIKADDFYRETNRLIYQTVAEMVIADEPLDMVNLSERLKRDGNLDKIGGLGVITDICQPEFVANVEAQAKIVADYAQRRRLIEKARILAANAQDMNQKPDEVACQIADDISGLTTEASENTKTAKDGVMDFASLVDKRVKRKGELLNTGLTDIDAKIKSFEAGQLVVIAGRPGHGKTALAGTIAVNMALRGKKILMFSMEMSHEELLGRFVSRLGGISGEKLKEPSQMTPDDWSAYVTALNSVGELPIAINSQGDLTPADVANVATRWQRHNGLDVIMIDYLQLMSSGKKTDSRVQEVSYITRTLKNLAVRLKLPIILLSQLSRANDKENRAPKLTDLRDSGTIEQDANTVLLIHRETSLSADKRRLKYQTKLM